MRIALPRWLPVGLVAAACLMWCGTAAATPSPLGAITEYPIPPMGVNTHPSPGYITVGSDGNLWFSDGGTATTQGAAGSSVGMVNLGTHAITEYPIAPPSSFGNSAVSGITAGPANDLWFTNDYGVGLLNPATHATAEYQITATPSTYTGPVPQAITAGSDGNLWFTANNDAGGAVGMFNPSTQAFTLSAITGSTGNVHPVVGAIVAGPDGNMWFTDHGTIGAGVGTVNLSTHAITQYPLPVSGGGALHGAFGIARGPDGNIWFTTNCRIGMINVSTHAIVEYAIPTTGGNAHPAPGAIVTGPGGNLWFADVGTVPSIGIIDPVTHAIVEQPVPGNAHYPGGIAAAPDGNIWFTDENANSAIGMITVPQKRPQLSGLRALVRARVVGGRQRAALTVKYRLTLAAEVALTLQPVAPGRVVNGHCVASTTANDRHRRCSRPGTPTMSISRPSSGGAQSFTVTSDNRGRAFAPGLYVLTARPLGGAGRGETRTVHVTVGA